MSASDDTSVATPDLDSATTELTPAGGNPGGLDLRRPKGSRTFVDVLMRALIWGSAVLALAPLLWILISVTMRGAPLNVMAPPDYTQLCVTDEGRDATRAPTEACGTEYFAEAPDGYEWRWVGGGRYPEVGAPFNTYGTLSLNRIERELENNPDLIVRVTSDEGAGWLLTPSMEWWTEPLGAATPQTPRGGALHAIYGSVVVTALTTLVAVPLALLGAVFLVEYARGTRLGRVVSFCVDILTGIPSIVAGLFIYTLLITTLGMGKSAFAVALALMILMIPVVLRSTEEMLKLVPNSLREASYALGVPKWKTIMSVVVPTARSGIFTGVILGIARVMGETAPWLILVGYATNLYLNPFSGSMGALPTMINTSRVIAPQFPGYDRTWGAAFTLIFIVMLLNLLARAISRAGQLKQK
ncbi:phosphate ABC transporter permease PstA [Parenemella sanctibonifatiensis]|nr:phosphate ABC transporter permease PstA [Parenemella sanctibonifatiensis]